MLGHHHHHTDAPACGHHHARNEGRALWAALITGVFMVLEAVGGIISGSLALIADAGHMLADSASLFLAWFGFRLARQPRDDLRTYGYHRFQILAAFANGLTLVIIAGWIVFEAVQRLLAPVAVEAQTMLGIAIMGLLVNIAAFFILHGADRDNLNIQGALVHVIGDLLGSVAAIIAALVITWYGWLAIDPLLSVLVALLILRSGWSITARSGHILLVGAPPHIDVHAVRDRLIAEVPGLRRVEDLHIWCLTQDRILATLQACVDTQADTCEARAAIRDNLDTHFGISHVTIEIRPDTEAPT